MQVMAVVLSWHRGHVVLVPSNVVIMPMYSVDAGTYDRIDMPAVLAAVRRWHRDGVWGANGVWKYVRRDR